MIEVFGVNALSGLAVSALFGGMLFFSLVMAPLIFSTLSSQVAGMFIRRGEVLRKRDLRFPGKRLVEPKKLRRHSPTDLPPT